MFRSLETSLILLLGSVISAWPLAAIDRNLQFTVFVYNDADAPERLLIGAEQDAGRVFVEAGLQAVFVNCRTGERSVDTPECGPVPAPAQLVVRLVPRSRTLGETAFGVAFLMSGGGTFADVFFDPLKRLRTENVRLVEASILGHVMAHEIGHLLLGSNAHSRHGIMQACWKRDQLRSIATGGLWFTSEQAVEMQRKVSSWKEASSRAAIVADARP